MSVPQAGMPQINDLVPSIGSSTQTYSASRRSMPNSSPMMPCSGKVRLISARMAASAARSAAVTGSKPPEPLLFSIPSALRKNGRMVSPEMVASSSTKALKSIAVIKIPASPAYTRLCAASLHSALRPSGIPKIADHRAPNRIGEILGNRERSATTLIVRGIIALLGKYAQFSQVRWGKIAYVGSIGLEFCAAQCMLLRCGSGRVSPATVALLGRFLPRLGPLPQGGRPFFMAGRPALFGGGAIRPQFFDRHPGKAVGQKFEFLRQFGKGCRRLIAALIHVQRTVDLKLNRVQSGSRIAVMLGDEAAGIWLVAAHGIAEAAHALLDCFRHDADTAGAVAITKNEIGARTLVATSGA